MSDKYSTLPIPVDRQAVVSIFGDPGTDGPDPVWVRQNIVECHMRGDVPPLPMVPPQRWIKVHRLLEPVLREALSEAEQATDWRPARFGMFVWRHQRHNPTRPLSLHSWGIAFDVDPHLNRAARFRLGNGPEPFSSEWFDRWPDGVPAAFVDVMEAHGFSWGGRWRRYCDPMHFEWYG